MSFTKKIGLKKIILFAIVILLALIVFIITYSKSGYANVYYRTFTKENGWTKWSKNGEVNGSDKNIKAIQVKVKSNFDGDIEYTIFSNGKWLDKKSSDEVIGDKTNDIYKIRLDLKGKLKEKYILKYRIKTTDGEWSIWGYKNLPLSKTNDETKNNEVLSIRKIQLKFEKK